MNTKKTTNRRVLSQARSECPCICSGSCQTSGVSARKFRNSLGLVVVLLLGFLSFVGDHAHLEAHPVPRGSGSAVVVEFEDDHLRLTVDIGFGQDTARGEMEAADNNNNGEVDEDEAKTYVEYSWTERARDRVILTLNKQRVALQPVKMWEEQLVGDVTDLPFNVYFECKVMLEYATPEDRAKLVNLDVRNRILLHPDLRRRGSTAPTWIIPVMGHSDDVSYMCTEPNFMESLVDAIAVGPRLIAIFDYSGGEEPTEDAKLLIGIPAGKPGERNPDANGDTERAEVVDTETGASPVVGGSSSQDPPAPWTPYPAAGSRRCATASPSYSLACRSASS